MTIQADSPDTSQTVCLAHALRLRSRFVEILVYESPSPGGLRDAHGKTMSPILGHFKKVPSETTNKQPKHTAVKDLFVVSPLAVSAHCSGLKFSLVQGGATRFTESESPIVKLELIEDFVHGWRSTTLVSWLVYFNWWRKSHAAAFYDDLIH